VAGRTIITMDVGRLAHKMSSDMNEQAVAALSKGKKDAPRSRAPRRASVLLPLFCCADRFFFCT
jgi:hypothetical protein